ncbi:hypothetical protein McanMca71_007882 [Microsporum canis]
MNTIPPSQQLLAFELPRDQVDGFILPTQALFPEYKSPASCPIRTGAQLSLFEDVSVAYEPSTWWLDGNCPEHPYFENDGRINFCVKAVKQPLLGYILEGCKLLLTRTGNSEFIPSITKHETLWKAAVSITTRSDCREEFLPAVQLNPSLFDKISTFLSMDGNAIRAINYAVHRLINSGTLTVDYQTYLIPPKAISSIGRNHVAVRQTDFKGDSCDLLEQSSAIWDLHDFAHLSAASLSPELFGSKYFSHLTNLPRNLTALIRSPKMKTSDPTPRSSDGVIFGELLTPLFTTEMEAVQRGTKAHTYSSLTDALAERIADYLMGRCELRHLTSGQMLRMKLPITAMQLAVLLQNKFYELTASEIEQRVFTRGGPVGDSKDELDGLTMRERIEALAKCRRWLYFEVRNTIKHRAHKLAYEKVAERMLADCIQESVLDDNLLELILKAIYYVGWEQGKAPNLWQRIADIESERANMIA